MEMKQKITTPSPFTELHKRHKSLGPLLEHLREMDRNRKPDQTRDGTGNHQGLWCFLAKPNGKI
ncbi:hypothetical protein KKF81_03885 [Candidatus Micrarchaeota archaeon]|nr:hypothetical protein [Candidatus Micrarchaeota archaeon]MBU1166065.1 hypothetical protein [Candidatus Micrarchaeota archaeon]MBU1886161.1 hypothetical protein [Candidatus Micrarchaeota archaeon]